MDPKRAPSASNAMTDWFGAAAEYSIDAAQRWILFLDVMRERGNAYHKHEAESAPHVLSFQCELVADGRTFERPVNYALVRIVPPEGVEIHPRARPFVVVDPRAGHGPGIGGFKADSEVGEAMRAGHPCYFVGFLPEPMPGQTIHDISRAEAVFLERVISLHPDADGKPCVIGNCQAGWAVMMLAAVRPELFGPIIIAGAPLSYWDGVRGQNPMRYSGGLLGGSWLTALASDLGAGKFDGGSLVQNFESQNPANTYWSKQYNLYSKIDTEAKRYLEFERWWGGHVNLNAEEIQFIVDELFVGNNLAAGKIKTPEGIPIDLRNIRSPIVVFCSKGDNITPPQQALGWLLDVFETTDDIRLCGQTIVYTIHETVGHLGIFVGSNIARKEHRELSDNIDLIDTLPPGLYEAIFEKRKAGDTNEDLISGDWIMRCEMRTLDDIRAIGGNDGDDERLFAAATRVSEINLAHYRTYMQPWVRAFANPMMADWMRKTSPLRLQYEIFSDANPFMTGVKAAAEQARKERKPVAEENPFLAAQEKMSDQIVAGFNAWRDKVEALSERSFLSIYGNPKLQSALGLDPEKHERSLRKAAVNPLQQQFVESRIAEIRARINSGGLRECIARACIYIGMARSSVDERGFRLIRRMRQESTMRDKLSPADFKALVREQFFMLALDEDAAIAAIPTMLPSNANERRAAGNAIREIANAAGELNGEAKLRLDRMVALFDGSGPKLVKASAR